MFELWMMATNVTIMTGVWATLVCLYLGVI
jgi:hypothetical protein